MCVPDDQLAVVDELIDTMDLSAADRYMSSRTISVTIVCWFGLMVMC